MTRKQIDQSREMRLWIGQVIVPTIVGGAMLMSNDKVKNFATDKYNKVKARIQKAFKKES